MMHKSYYMHTARERSVVILLFDRFDETGVTSPQKPSADKDCPFYNIYTIWSW